ncbi:MAG TPA: DinB family protein [Pyrinomonadaceae bacterium]
MQAQAKQNTIATEVINEMDREAEITNRLFDIIPDDKLDFRPHAKAKSLGELAMHIAVLPGNVAAIAVEDVHEFAGIPKDPEAASRAQIQATFAESLEKAKEIVRSTDDENAVRELRLVADGKTLFAAPRVGFWRTVLLNHNYHHRGQLSTYLRILDVPLPSIYGPSADTNPFA